MLNFFLKDQHPISESFQSGLNSLMNTIKFILVVALPDIETFGFLVILSFSSISIGTGFYLAHAVDRLANSRKQEPENPGETEKLRNDPEAEPLSPLAAEAKDL